MEQNEIYESASGALEAECARDREAEGSKIWEAAEVVTGAADVADREAAMAAEPQDSGEAREAEDTDEAREEDGEASFESRMAKLGEILSGRCPVKYDADYIRYLITGRSLPPESRAFYNEAMALGRRRLFEIWAIASRVAADYIRENLI